MDDNKGLEYLQQTQDVDMADNDNTQSSTGNDPDEENDENDTPRYVSRAEVVRQVREAAQTKPDDVSLYRLSICFILITFFPVGIGRANGSKRCLLD